MLWGHSSGSVLRPALSGRSFLLTASINLPAMGLSHLGNGTSSSSGAFRCETLIQDPSAELLLSPDPQKL